MGDGGSVERTAIAIAIAIAIGKSVSAVRSRLAEQEATAITELGSKRTLNAVDPRSWTEHGPMPIAGR